MAARLLDGIAVAQAIRADMRPRVDAFAARAGRPPAIALVLVGNDGGSELYVASKLKSAGESGIRAALTRLPETASIEALLDVVAAETAPYRHRMVVVRPDQVVAWRGDVAPGNADAVVARLKGA